jgi:LemA protein
MPQPTLVRFAILVLAALDFFCGCQGYDVLVTKDQVCQQRWADVDAQLQRRADLVPNLVEVVRASAKHEEETLARVTQARASATALTLKPEDLEDADKMAAFAKAQDDLRGALARLLVVRAQPAYRDRAAAEHR